MEFDFNFAQIYLFRMKRDKNTKLKLHGFSELVFVIDIVGNREMVSRESRFPGQHFSSKKRKIPENR